MTRRIPEQHQTSLTEPTTARRVEVEKNCSEVQDKEGTVTVEQGEIITGGKSDLVELNRMDQDSAQSVNRCAIPVRNVRINENNLTVSMGEQSDKCALVRKKTWCERHNCQVNKVTVTSKKWQWIKSKNCYGNVSSQVSKYLCKSKKSGRVEPIVPPTHSSLADNVYGGKSEVRRGSSYVVRHIATSINERESKLADGDVYSLTGSKSLNPFS